MMNKNLSDYFVQEEAKLNNKFSKIMCEWREKIDDGFSIDNLGIYFVD
jgi:hypothetical protein